MTTFRRFCCNNLLLLGSINLQPTDTTFDMFYYMRRLANWPANCHVAYFPGGQIAGYTFGIIEGIGTDRCGRITLVSFSTPDDLDLETKLVKLLDDSCDKIYNAYYMKLFLPDDSSDNLKQTRNLGYKWFALHVNDKIIEVRKPLPRSAWLDNGVGVLGILDEEDRLRSKDVLINWNLICL